MKNTSLKILPIFTNEVTDLLSIKDDDYYLACWITQPKNSFEKTRLNTTEPSEINGTVPHLGLKSNSINLTNGFLSDLYIHRTDSGDKFALTETSLVIDISNLNETTIANIATL